MEWLAPVAALLGVIVGGVLNAGLTAEFERRRELAAATVAARLVREELKLIRDTVRTSLRDGRWGAILDPGLPYARGLWAVEHREGRRDESAWTAHASRLAGCVTSDDWEALAIPYERIDRTSLWFWTDDPNRALDDKARDFLRTLSESIDPAIRAVEPVAQGMRKTRLQRLLGSS